MKKMYAGLFVFILILVLSACGTEEASQASSEPKTNNSEAITINQDIPDNEVISTGPYGESAISAKTLQLTAEEVAKIKEGNFTAAISLHYAGNDWSNAQVKGITETFEKMGIEVISVTDAQFRPEKQVADIETILARNPDILVSFPVDPVSMAPSYKQALDAGVKLVFMDNPPQDFVAGEDYVSVVSADNYGNGVEAAHLLAKSLGEKGKIGVLFLDIDFFVTNQRKEAFEKTIKEQYPDIEIVASAGVADPNEADAVASALLTRHPDLDGMFSVWDLLGDGVMSAARTAGREDLAISTIDLGINAAISIAQGGMTKGLGAQLPYDQGVAEAILGGYSLLGKEAPPYVAVPAMSVTQENVLEAWETVYQTEPPVELQEAAKQ
ncbi:substrate-binding domain-containing protein [Halalkalibacter nanhaiisediminis]|uniref:Ribose transport system substrate-binding protein n=1 Tax=Halalkalibacter nanhaiisediminis TaxID=688079 RepID=A0A562QT14_9BACI|nr:substrate-binding domain-containing protein [Halalkalibacter nanhaiisediminis]TWI59899.1 ribose transport system substrate-binding protein [Halalkalibacter nanhaiisediminis]